MPLKERANLILMEAARGGPGAVYETALRHLRAACEEAMREKCAVCPIAVVGRAVVGVGQKNSNTTGGVK